MSVETWGEAVSFRVRASGWVGMACVLKLRSIKSSIGAPVREIWQAVAGGRVAAVRAGGGGSRYPLHHGSGAGGSFRHFTALLFRTVGVLLCLVGTELNWKSACSASSLYLPKATVQAVMGPCQWLWDFPVVRLLLSVAVMAILITAAPLGALGMDSTFEKLLEKE